MDRRFNLYDAATLAVIAVVIMLLILFFSPVPGHADAPDCTTDRHLDECGQMCPDPNQVTTTTTTEDPTTTTTTLLDETCPCAVSFNQLNSSLFQEFRRLESQHTKIEAEVTALQLSVNELPGKITFPIYARCKETGKSGKGNTFFHGHWYKCQNPATPRRFYLPTTH